MSAALKALRDLTATNRAASDGKAHEGKAPQPAPKTAPIAPVVASQLQQVAQEAAASANQRQAQNLSDAIQELNGEYFLAPEGGKVCVWCILSSRLPVLTIVTDHCYQSRCPTRSS